MPPTFEDRPVLSIIEAARYAGVSRSTIYRLINDNQLGYVELRGRRLIRRDSLDQLLREARESGWSCSL